MYMKKRKRWFCRIVQICTVVCLAAAAGVSACAAESSAQALTVDSQNAAVATGIVLLVGIVVFLQRNRRK